MDYIASCFNSITQETTVFDRSISAEEKEFQFSHWSVRTAQQLIDAWNRQPLSQITGLKWSYQLK